MSDKFWITTELTHGEGVRSGAAGVICGHRDGAESKYISYIINQCNTKNILGIINHPNQT